MERPTIALRPRDEQNPRALRRNGFIPVSVFEGGQSGQSFQVSRDDLKDVLKQMGSAGLVQVKPEGGRRFLAIAREIQHHPVSREVLSVSLQRIAEKQRVHVTIPISLDGQPAAVADNTGTLLQTLDQLDLEASAAQLPERIHLDVSAMEIGNVMHVSDLPVPDGCKVLAAEDTVVATLTLAKEQPIETVEMEPATEEASGEAAA